ncbi:hypothetical protein DUI87_13964 [Hirundo rustica rustica]|uniref:Uncharacterized protein n=1 Tax=Hirundo rustica rustica TaxID=333673 RepID=A0A3M0K739_HIRRU|nr:hypothetical protein DUI87_13964 [Hirundo rustica rustica]
MSCSPHPWLTQLRTERRVKYDLDAPHPRGAILISEQHLKDPQQCPKALQSQLSLLGALLYRLVCVKNGSELKLMGSFTKDTIWRMGAEIQKCRGIYCSVFLLTISKYNDLLEPIKEQETRLCMVLVPGTEELRPNPNAQLQLGSELTPEHQKLLQIRQMSSVVKECSVLGAVQSHSRKPPGREITTVKAENINDSKTNRLIAYGILSQKPQVSNGFSFNTGRDIRMISTEIGVITLQDGNVGARAVSSPRPAAALASGFEQSRFLQHLEE